MEFQKLIKKIKKISKKSQIDIDFFKRGKI